MEEKEIEIRPITLTDNNTGDKYILEFNRESIERAENMGLNVDELGEKPATMIPLFFHCAFYMHHRNTVSRQKSDKILQEMGGMTRPFAQRLYQLYELGLKYLIAEEEPKNARMTVEM